MKSEIDTNKKKPDLRPERGFEYQFQIFVNELNMCSQIIAKYDDILFKVSGWSITIFSLFIGAAIQQGRASFAIAGIVPIFLFWVYHAIYKGFQRSFIVRYNRMEHYLRSSQFKRDLKRGDISEIVFPDITGKHSVSNWMSKTSAVKAFFLIHNSFVYISMIAMCIAVSCFIYFSD